MANPQHDALRKFGYQIKFAIDHYKPHGLKAGQFGNVIISGLGGSGIGGRIVKSLFASKFPVPVECVADYHLPGYVNEKTLVILGSYSGNTEETLRMYEEAKTRGCTMIILTSGGKLGTYAEEQNIVTYHIEPGFQPRMALGFSLTYLVQVFAELAGQDAKEELTQVAALFEDTSGYEKEATKIFDSIKSKLKNKLIVLTDGPMEPVGVRFAQQIQENAKHECFTHVLPEMNHNVIESYYGQLESIFVFIDSQENERVGARFEFLNSLLGVENNRIVNITLHEFSYETVYETIHRLDWLSLYIADYRNVDSLNVPNISQLKEFLEQID